MNTKDLMPERVTLPDLTAEEEQQIADLKELFEWRERTQIGFLKALLAKGTPFTGVRKPQPKPSKHQRRIASARARSEFLVSVGRSRKPVTTDA